MRQVSKKCRGDQACIGVWKVSRHSAAILLSNEKNLVIVVLSLATALFLAGCGSLPEGNRGDFSMPQQSGGHQH
jgi:hypothetical protein